MSTPSIPPVQQAYFKKRGERNPYELNTPSGSGGTEGHVGGAPMGFTQQHAFSVYTQPTLNEKASIRGMGYFRFMAALQTLFQLGILVCMIAMVAKLYNPGVPASSSSRF